MIIPALSPAPCPDPNIRALLETEGSSNNENTKQSQLEVLIEISSELKKLNASVEEVKKLLQP